MKRLLVLLALLPVLAHAQALATLNVSWALPTTFEGGGAIPATGADALASTRVEYGTCNGAAFGVVTLSKVVLVPSVSTTFTNVVMGNPVCLRVFAKTNAGIESVSSVVIQAGQKPQPGGIVTVVFQ